MTAATDTSPSGLRVAVVMDLSSPWSIDIAASLASLCREVIVFGYSPRRRSTDRAALAREREGSTRITALGGQIETVACPDGQSAAVLHITRALRRLDRSNRADIVLCLYGGIFATAAYASGFRPYAVYWVGSDVPTGRSAQQWLLQHVASAAALNIANGLHLAERANFWFSRRDVLPLYLGVDTSLYHRPISDGAAVTVSILCARWFEPLYDNLTIVRAFLNASAQLPAARMIFTSPGSQLDEAKTLAATQQAGISSHPIDFRGGVSADEMGDVLRRSDIYVSMSKSDGTSTALLEALSAGAYPILSDIPANREWIDNHGCLGTLVPVGDVAALSAAIVLATNDAAGRQRARGHNIEIVKRLADSMASRRNLADLLVTAVGLNANRR